MNYGKLPKDELNHTWGRFGSFAWDYMKIAEKDFHEFLLCEEKPVEHPGEDKDPSEYFEYRRRKYEAAVKTVVFSAMCVEAAIFDFASIYLGDDYARQYVDKLDLVAKWVVIPRLVIGQSLDIRGPAMNNLINLVQIRNSLVHAKSYPYDEELKNLEKYNKQVQKFYQNVSNSYRCIVLLSLELNMLMGVSVGVLLAFERNLPSVNEKPSLLLKEIERCRYIHDDFVNKHNNVNS